MSLFKKESDFIEERSGQVTIFIIIAILLVVAFALFFFFRGGPDVESVPSSLSPVYSHFLSCVDDKLSLGVGVLLDHAGFIESPPFEPGSYYSPFSSELNFLGISIPYWSYVSGNNLVKENIPTKKDMEDQLALFVNDQISDCEFNEFFDEGYVIDLGTPSSQVSIKDEEVEITLEMSLSVSRESDAFSVLKHQRAISTKFGALYSSALKVYEREQEELFLENYSVDVLRFYAPVDGVEITCSPKIWNAVEVFENLSLALEANILAVRGDNSEFSLSREENKYFVVDLGVEEEVRFVTSKDWPHNFEVNPSEGSLLIASPVGNQLGLNVIGFCYAPYHFVYDVRYPVLVQVSSGDETFQFPLAVVIEGNKPREALISSAVGFESLGICENKNTLTEVRTFDTSSNIIAANISFECSFDSCLIGESSGVLREDFPQCGNGIIKASAPGYKSAQQIYSTIEEGSVDIILEKIYSKNVQLFLEGRPYNGQAIITFTSDDFSRSVVYPDITSVDLAPGEYDLQVFVYRDTTLNLGATTVEQCVDVPRGGIGTLLGLTKKECFDIEYPEQLISSALVGGGKTTVTFFDADFSFSSEIRIFTEDFGNPTSFEELSTNYLLFEGSDVEVRFI